MTKKKEIKNALAGAFTQFITQTPPPEQSKQERKPQRKQKGFKNVIPWQEQAQRKKRAAHNAQYINLTPERAEQDHENPRNRRVQLLFRADIHAELATIAREQGRSLNNLIEGILTAYLEDLSK